MKEEIIKKLHEFLKEHSQMTEECHVVYLMVEIRKLIEQLDLEKECPILRFYCNWSVHTKKERDNRAINEVIQEIERSIVSGKKFQETKQFIPNGNSLLDFISFTELKKEMECFFNKFSFPIVIFEENNWYNFRDLLIQILTDQPITNINGNITLIQFISARKGAAALHIEFKDGNKFTYANLF